MLDEFQFIQRIKSKYGLQAIGDDCAVLQRDEKNDLVVTADMLVENIDFRLEWTQPEFLGHKSAAVSFSDVAAMGGRPLWSMLSLAVPDGLWKSDFVDRFYDGWLVLAREFEVELVGGDISRSESSLVIDSIVGGEVIKGRAIRRSGAGPGDAIFVTGTLGGAAGGLKLLERGFVVDAEFPDLADKILLRQLKPMPQVAMGISLQTLNVITAMIDLSDGLSSDLNHVCEASGTGAEISADLFPLDPDIGNYFHSEDCMEMALHGGEDFGLLFTAPEKDIAALNSLGATRIGFMTENTGIIELIRDGQRTVLEPGGFRHF